MCARARVVRVYYGYACTQVVIANQLDTRKRMVVLVSSSEETPITMTDDEISKGDEIERKIVDDIVKLHHIFIATNK